MTTLKPLMNAVRERPRSSLIQPASLFPENQLGLGIQLQFRTLRALITRAMPLDHPLLPGQFVFGVRANVNPSSSSALNGVNLTPEQIFVLRIEDVEPLPEPGTRAHALCERLWPQTGPGLEASLGVLRCEVLGAFESPPVSGGQPHFSSTMNVHDVAHRLQVYRADRAVMETLVNGTVNTQARINFGLVRPGEDTSYLADPHNAYVSMLDIRGKRTAMFGKTRLGKSNVVKLIVQGMLEVTAQEPNVGQIIFDVNGEYANTNPQDGDSAIATAYKDRCLPYFLKELDGNPEARLLRFNFYERTHDAFEVLQQLLPPELNQVDALRNLYTCKLPKLERYEHEHEAQLQRRLRKVMIFWAVLHTAGFESDTLKIKAWLQSLGLSQPFNPCFSQNLRKAAFLAQTKLPPPSAPFNFTTMAYEMRVIANFMQQYPNDPSLNSNGYFIFDEDEQILCKFLCAGLGEGPDLLRTCMAYHSPSASDFTADIIEGLNNAKTVVINLGSANEQIIRYFAKSICLSIFHEQERKFVSNQLNGHYVQIYFEEAHMIFPTNAGTVIDVYSRFAKEGAKFNIGIVYSTQSPTTVNRDLLSQTENFFIGHLSSQTEADYLSSVQMAFKGREDTIMRNRTPGLMQMLTYSHRYVVPIQAHRYEGRRQFELPPQV